MGKVSKYALYVGILCVLCFILLPLPTFKPSFSKAIYSREGALLSATVSQDQQWCLMVDKPIPEKLKKCIVLYEDAYMDYHPGINPVSVIKAAITNIRLDRIQRGASTLAMQVMRIKNKNARRTWFNKFWESISAIKYSLLHSDDEILKEWCSLAPFGGNTIGIKAASLRYFGREFDGLSWAEYALLAVMPNGPTTANLSHNKSALKAKRNFLLKKLYKSGYFDQNDLEILLEEPLPEKINEVPQNAYHALIYASTKYPEMNLFNTTLSGDIQKKTVDLLEQESALLKSEGILNVAMIIIDVESNEVVAYHGNSSGGKQDFSYVDIVQAKRSYGSLLKPLLYAHVVENSQFLPHELIPDIPTAIGGFQPENFDKKYRGAVRLSDMVTQSLNIPAVRVLHASGQQPFYRLIERLKLAGIDKGTSHYGLSIILGGAETSMWDLSRMYKGFARNYYGNSQPYNEVTLLMNREENNKNSSEVKFSNSTMAYLIDAMADVTRPREEKAWQMYGINHKIAWKTGTSFGHRDAWSFGFNAKYMVGVWVGNESGEGRFGLTGIEKAAPIMFRAFHLLSGNRWFNRTVTEEKGENIAVCTESGKIAGPLCKHKRKESVTHGSMHLQQCTYHQEILVNNKGRVVTPLCDISEAKKDTAFILPPQLEYYYQQANPAYSGMPPTDSDCGPGENACKIIYPQNGVHIFLPRESKASPNVLVAKAYHRDQKGELYWFVDQTFITKTSYRSHECVLSLQPGKHTISITDKRGNSDAVNLHIMSSVNESRTTRE